MSRFRCHISISPDGHLAGPNQSKANPLGERGERLHDSVVSLAAWRETHGQVGGDVNESARIVEETRANIGATVMGRNMFGAVPASSITHGPPTCGLCRSAALPLRASPT